MRQSLRFIPCLIALAALFVGAPGAKAEGIKVESAEARSLFPDGIIFNVTASSEAKITNARLRYRLLPSKIESTIRAECEGDARVTCKVTLGGSIGRAFYIVPFAEVLYFWELTDAAGNSLTTEPRSTFYDDIRFQWRTLSEGNLALHYYSGDDAGARTALAAGRDAIDKHSALLGTQLDFPVKVIEYASASDLEEASTRGRRGGGNIILAGQMVADDTVVMTRETLGADADVLDILRHELAHVVTGHAVRDGRIDAWMNEGLSMYAQRVVERGFTQALRQGIRTDKLYPLVSLNSNSVRQNDPDLFYAQAHSMVAFLIDTHGRERFREVIAALNDGKTTEEAMQAIYGFGKDAFEDEWRKTLGSSPVLPGSQPSTVLVEEANAASVSVRSKSSSPLPIAGAIIAAVIVIGGAGTMVMRRKKA